MTARASASALSLVEVLVAVGILMLVLLGVVAAQSSATLQREVAQEDHLARRLALSFVEDMRDLPVEEAHDLGPWADRGVDDTSWEPPPSAGVLTELAPDAEIDVLRIPHESGAEGGIEVDDNGTPDDTSDDSLVVDDLASLGFSSGEVAEIQSAFHFPFDLDGDDSNDDDDDFNDGRIEPGELRLLPARVRITWTSGALGERRRQDYYVVFSDF